MHIACFENVRISVSATTTRCPKMNKFEQVSSDHDHISLAGTEHVLSDDYQMSLAGGGDPGLDGSVQRVWGLGRR